MQIKIGNRKITNYNSISVSLRYDTVGSPFSFELLFDATNPVHRELFVPGSFNTCEITYGNETLIKGVVIGQAFKSSAKQHLMRMGGYTKSGVLEDSQNAVGNQTQFLANPTLNSMAKTLCTPFGINVIVDDIVRADADSAYTTQPIIEPGMSIKDFLAQNAKEKNIVLSHDAVGNLLLTRANVDKKPIYKFDGSIPAISMELFFDGQPMHNKIWVVGQYETGDANSSQDREPQINPYVQSKTELSTIGSTFGLPAIAFETGNRPGVYMQGTSNNNTTPLTARQYLSKELKSIRLTIEIEGWELDGKIVRPNNIITVVNPDIFLYQRTKWFIESVDFRGDASSETALLTCVLPECYGTGDVKNVFTGTNLTAPFKGSAPIHGD